MCMHCLPFSKASSWQQLAPNSMCQLDGACWRAIFSKAAGRLLLPPAARLLSLHSSSPWDSTCRKQGAALESRASLSESPPSPPQLFTPPFEAETGAKSASSCLPRSRSPLQFAASCERCFAAADCEPMQRSAYAARAASASGSETIVNKATMHVPLALRFALLLAGRRLSALRALLFSHRRRAHSHSLMAVCSCCYHPAVVVLVVPSVPR